MLNEVIVRSDRRTNSWNHKLSEFSGANSRSIQYGFVLNQPTDTKDSYFTVIVTHQITDINGLAFSGETQTTFKIADAEKPSLVFLYNCVIEATLDFSEIFTDKTFNTSLSYIKISKPLFSSISLQLERYTL